MVYLRTVTKQIPESLRPAFQHCARMAQDHYENFPVASWLLPSHLRPHLHSIYAFARTADDFADEPGLEDDERLEKLTDWRRRLHACRQQPDGPIFEALAETIRQFDIPGRLLEDLLDAFSQDIVQSRHRTFDDLLAYSRKSANPVGRLVLILFGYHDKDQLSQSDAICTALQLTNFWQDVGIDHDRDRIYLPQEDMNRYDISETTLAQKVTTPGFRSLLSDLSERTRNLFLAGSGLPSTVTGRLRYELRMTWLGGWHILNQIEQVDYDVFRRRPTVTRWSACRLLLRSLFPLRTPV